MNEKKDLRVLKTKKNLFETLINLLKEKPFEEIKVSDICEKAMINRSTFYAHYTDKYELLAAYIDDLRMHLAAELEKNTAISNMKEYYLEMISLFLNQVESKKDIFNSIIVNNKNSIIMDMIYDVARHDIKRHLDEDTSSQQVPNQIVSEFYIGAVFNVGISWLQNNNNYSKQEILEYLEKMIPIEPHH